MSVYTDDTESIYIYYIGRYIFIYMTCAWNFLEDKESGKEFNLTAVLDTYQSNNALHVYILNLS